MQADDTEHCYQKQTKYFSTMEFQDGANHLGSVHPNELVITTPQKNTLKSVEYMEYKISFSFVTHRRQLCALGVNILHYYQ